MFVLYAGGASRVNPLSADLTTSMPGMTGAACVDTRPGFDSVWMPLLNSVLGSNRLQVQHAVDRIVDTGKKRIGLLGFSFKAGTDDLRESPIVILAEALLGKGCALKIYDRNVSLAKLVGANKEYIERQIPHLSSLLCNTIDEVLDGSDVVIVGNASPEFADALTRTRADHVVFDLVRIGADLSKVAGDYRGICW